MEIKVLEEFCILAETGSFSKASQKLLISQPILTRHIQKLEQELGYSLFDRSTRMVALNASGALFFPYAQQMVDTYQNYRYAAAHSKATGGSLSLKIGMAESFSQSSIHDTIFRFATASGISPQFSEGPTDKLKEMLYSSRLDLVITYEKKDVCEDGFSRLTYFSDELAAVLPSLHELSEQPFISLSDLASSGFILLREDYMIGRLSLQCCQLAGFQPRIVHASKFEDNVLEMVRKNVGVSILLKLPRKANGIVILDMKPTIRVDLNLLYCEENASPAVRELIRFIREQRPNIGV